MTAKQQAIEALVEISLLSTRAIRSVDDYGEIACKALASLRAEPDDREAAMVEGAMVALLHPIPLGNGIVGDLKNVIAERIHEYLAKEASRADA